jgi:hypothetical protein
MPTCRCSRRLRSTGATAKADDDMARALFGGDGAWSSPDESVDEERTARLVEIMPDGNGDLEEDGWKCSKVIVQRRTGIESPRSASSTRFWSDLGALQQSKQDILIGLKASSVKLERSLSIYSLRATIRKTTLVQGFNRCM